MLLTTPTAPRFRVDKSDARQHRDAVGAPGDALSALEQVDARSRALAAERLVRMDAARRELLSGERAGADPAIAERSIRLEVAVLLRVSENAAARMLAIAEAVIQRFPGLLASLSGARTTLAHVEVAVEQVAVLPVDVQVAVVRQALDFAETEGIGPFRRRMRRLVDAARVDTVAERAEEAITRRRVVVEDAGDGMSWLSALLPSVHARAILTRVSAMAKALRDRSEEDRTTDQVRADIVADLLVDGRAPAHPESVQGVRATVAVTVPALALIGREAEGVDEGAVPVVDGVGPIPVAWARELCAGAEGWMRVLTHPETGVVLSVGRERYRPPASLRRLVRWRAGRCAAPGCLVPAARCDIDHTVAWEDGGATSSDNLAPLCTGHHTVKHHGGWRVRHADTEDGALEWTSPGGRRYTTRPERPVPRFLSDRAAAPF